jgi:CDP-glycerol glycerophosphotransferase (TagB/SpsB family)
VFWLVDDDPVVARRYVIRRRVPNVEVVPKKTLRAVWLALTAELTFFTHGLFTAVRPPANRLVVNLWHGDGPKTTRDAGYIASTVVVTGARMWQGYKARTFGLRSDDVAWTGNPRSDALLRGMTAEQWKRLDLDAHQTLVLWMPTYRVARNEEGLLWEDGTPLSRRSDLVDLRELASVPGVSVVVKPHPMDRDNYSRLGIRILTDADLQAADVALYELLGCCSALISDTSSTWVDFLPLGRPIAFFLPDAEELEATRGLNVSDLPSILPGPVLRDVRDIRDFLESVARDPEDPRLIEAERRERIGPAPLGDAPGRLLDWLDDYQVDRGRRPLCREQASGDAVR